MKQVKAQPTTEATLAQIIQELSGTIVHDSQAVTQRVIDRYLIAPIGIPETQLRLYSIAPDKETDAAVLCDI